jgi:hypothetical protein
MDVRGADCNKKGLVLDNGVCIPWSEVAVMGKCIPVLGSPRSF